MRANRWLTALAERPLDEDERRAALACEAARTQLASSFEPVGDVYTEVLSGLGARLTSAAEALAERSVPPAKAMLLHRLVMLVRPQRVVEFGSALGISGAYLASAVARVGHGELVTIEGSPSCNAIAARTIEDVAPGVARAVCGLFDDHLDELAGADIFFLDGNHFSEPTFRYLDAAVASMARPAFVVLDDIAGYSDDMEGAWARLRTDGRFSASDQAESVGVLTLGKLDIGGAAIARSRRRWRR